MRKMLSNKTAIAILVLPALIFYTVFVFVGVVRSFAGSLYKWDGITAGKYVGLDNFKKLFSQDVFYLALKNGLITVGILLLVQIGLALTFAFILSKKEIRYKKAFRVIYFLPMVMSVSAVCILASAVLMPEGGLFNNVLHALGIKYAQKWFISPGTSIVAISFVNAWQFFGLFLIIFYTGIKSIPPHYFEAATMDGASGLRTYTLVTIPLLADVLKFCILLSTLAGLNQFAQNLIITGGGPGYIGYSLTLLLYFKGFSANDYGYGSALAVVIIIQALLVSFIINRFIARERITY